jgi:Domain of unknown function (DUF4160)
MGRSDEAVSGPDDGSLMPTVLRAGPYRFYFYSHEPNEPPHIHVDRDDLSPKELRRIQRIVDEHVEAFLEAWHGHLGAGG